LNVEVVSGLLYLHSHGIMHRDLTLANIMLTKEMNIKIGDFGLATQVKSIRSGIPLIFLDVVKFRNFRV
jgi:serine/threonine protein kinase